MSWRRGAVPAVAAALAASSLVLAACGDSGTPSQVDRIEACLQKAGFETRQGWFTQTAGPASGAHSRAIFVGPTESPTVTLVVLGPRLRRGYYTELGQTALAGTGGEIVKGNVLMQPGSARGTIAVSGERPRPMPIRQIPRIGEIRSCTGAGPSALLLDAPHTTFPQIKRACGTVVALGRHMNVDIPVAALPTTCDEARAVISTYLARSGGRQEGDVPPPIRIDGHKWDCNISEQSDDGYLYFCDRIPFKDGKTEVAAGREYCSRDLGLGCFPKHRGTEVATNPASAAPVSTKPCTARERQQLHAGSGEGCVTASIADRLPQNPYVGP
jgi:hypothetical protein